MALVCEVFQFDDDEIYLKTMSDETGEWEKLASFYEEVKILDYEEMNDEQVKLLRRMERGLSSD